jgi:hypothetical protein
VSAPVNQQSAAPASVAAPQTTSVSAPVPVEPAPSTPTAPLEQPTGGEDDAEARAAPVDNAPSADTPKQAVRKGATAHRHYEPRFRGHPGSIELDAPATGAPADAPAPSDAAPAIEGFPIAPPTTLVEPPPRQPLPPTEPEAPPPTAGDSPVTPTP